jgi:glycosyltransferase involved in cell wall biosynthesis
MKKVAFFLPNLHGGGAERISINLLKDMATNPDLELELVLAKAEGPYLNQVPESVRVVDLSTERVIKAVFPLSRYLQASQPDALLSHMSHANVAAMLAQRLTDTKTQMVLVEHGKMSTPKSHVFRTTLVPLFMRWLYPKADKIVGVSDGVTQDLHDRFDLPEEKLQTIYNPVVNAELLVKSQQAVDHPWLQPGQPPVFLAVGRLTRQKDFPNLIQAFAQVRQVKPAKLIILGEGEARDELTGLIHQLALTQDVMLPGFVKNPFAYMNRAAAFVLSSRWEGLPTVLIEAMACGCPVVATDCPSGPQEILAAGKYGELVPIENADRLAQAMLHVLDQPLPKTTLVDRAMDFSFQQAVDHYLALLN